jgi:sulfate adenylyltransferase
MIRPHGGKIIDRRLRMKIDTKGIPKLEVNTNQSEDIMNIANGVFSPLEGFLDNGDLENVIAHKRLSDDTPWTIPIVLDFDKTKHKDIEEGDTILLVNKELGLETLIDIDEIFSYDKKVLAEAVYRTLETAHPGVATVFSWGPHLIGGKITLLSSKPREFDEYNLAPKETRVLFKEKGWKEVVAFQTRNPPHIGHEYVQKTALTMVDGLFINPIIGKKKTGDFRDDVILKSYEALMKYYYRKERAVMSILRTSMKYGGPREAIHHSIMRKNFGCTHFIVGRDHAGVGSYYGPYDAHEIFNEFPDLEITPIFFRSFSRCKKCSSVVNDKICPHGQEDQINFSGKKIREILNNGKIPPEDMMRKEVAQEILKYKDPFVK